MRSPHTVVSWQFFVVKVIYPTPPHSTLTSKYRLRPHVRDRHGGAEPAVPALLVRRVVNALPLVLRSHGADGGRGGLFSGVIVGTLLARLEVSLPFIQHTSITEE